MAPFASMWLCPWSQVGYFWVGPTRPWASLVDLAKESSRVGWGWVTFTHTHETHAHTGLVKILNQVGLMH